VRGSISTACILVACIAAGCGGSKPSVDSGGFTSAQRTSAQTALDRLQGTPVPRVVVGVSQQSGQAPPTCIVLPRAASKGSFQLLVAWKPTGAFARQPQTVLEATIDERSAKDDRYHVSTFASGTSLPATVQAKLVRATLAKPAEQCEVLENGRLQLVQSQ
jgi:hypothetical protein